MMKNIFPEIHHIDDVLPHVQGLSDFQHSVKDGYQVITYRSLGNPQDTFPDNEEHASKIRRECRGIKFDMSGKIISRPFHKFFNYRERPSTSDIDFNSIYCIMEKRDGSMICPVFINGKIHLTTKAGITDTSRRCENWLVMQPNAVDYYKIFNFFLEKDITPIFEWCSLEDRIILEYKESSLVFLNARHNVSGEYLLDVNGNWCGFEYPYPLNSIPKIETFRDVDVEKLKEQENIEGVVIQYDNGDMIKIKTEWYCLLHRSKETCQYEKNVLEVILSDQLDDLIPTLSDEYVQKITKYASLVNHTISLNCCVISNEISHCKSAFSSRKEVALYIVEKMNNMGLSELLPVFWKCFDGAEVFDTLRTRMLNKCGSHRGVEEMRNLIGTTYE